MADQMLMKDGLGAAAIDRIAKGLQASWSTFDSKAFALAANSGIESLELKERVQHLIGVLNQFLPKNYPEAAAILSKIPENWDFGDTNDSLKGFAAWPLIDYSAEYGLNDPEIALETLKNLTHLFSSEFAIRPFILRHPELCFAKFDNWIEDESEHIRRLVSEGSRPRLPWGIRLQPFCDDPTPILTLLEPLNNDPSDYVRRSVANNINDISKDNPDTAVELCTKWTSEDSEPVSTETKWIVRHAMRSLIKDGRADVFPLLGFTANPKLDIGTLELGSAEVKLGESLSFSTQVKSEATSSQRLAIDFAIHHRKANGSLSAKVFKWKEINLDPGEVIQIAKKHPIKKITTRAYYSGSHKLELIVNGKSRGISEFYLDCMD
ncbi:MAG: DNA alkylation repair protein [Porticoccaceae bacterium]|jgi:3-methyladenine DNA glycosylase AlkC|nr:DNA alkylation repair protein [Porticoccaceae bacterium]